MRFLVEVVLSAKGALVARQLDPGPFDVHSAALLGEHMIMKIQQPKAVDPEGKPRTDLFAFRLDLDPNVPPPKAGDVLEVGLMDATF